MHQTEQAIFKKGSTTYYWSSKFFPRSVRGDVFKLYSFVRVVDDYVDTIPPDLDSFNTVKHRWKEIKRYTSYDPVHYNDNSVLNRVLKNIAQLTHYYGFAPEWTDSFLASMQMDVDGRRYENLEQSLEYVYGSAEVIGLYMARLLKLPPAATQAAMMQGRAMQWINFIRDIAEDNQLGRCYFPQADLRKFGLSDLAEKTCRANSEGFTKFMHFQLRRYRAWQKEAEAGFRYIPRRLRVPIRTAADMYSWTAHQIELDPFIIFDHKVKPSKQRVVGTVSKRILHA